MTEDKEFKHNSETEVLELAYNYYTGNGVIQDFRKAAELYRDLADKGNAKAAYNYGILLNNGKATGKPERELALNYLRKSAELGNEDARKKVKQMEAATMTENRKVQGLPETIDNNCNIKENQSLLLEKLVAAKKVTDQAEPHLNEYNNYLSKAGKWRKRKYTWFNVAWIFIWLFVCVYGAAVFGNLTGSELSWIPISVIVSIVAWIVSNNAISKACKNKAETTMDVIRNIYQNNIKDIMFLPSRYWASESVAYLMELVQFNRGVTFNDVLNLADVKNHQDQMISNQQTMLDSLDDIRTAATVTAINTSRIWF